MPKGTEEHDNYLLDFVSMSTVSGDKAFLDANNCTVEVSDYCGQPFVQSTFSSVIQSDAEPVVEDAVEQSFYETDNYDDVIDDSDDVTHRYIDRVFFACDADGTGSVAVSLIICYLSDTLRVSNFLHVLLKYCTFSSVASLNRYSCKTFM